MSCAPKSQFCIVDMWRSKLKAFRINLFDERQTYSAGSEIEGNVFLELSKDMVSVKSIIIQLNGVSSVQWSEGGGDGRRVYKNSDGICRLEWTIWRNEGSYQQQASSTGLVAGQHQFPFKIQIPADLALPTSFKGPFGVIQYSLIAGITKSQETKLKHTISREITVKKIINTNVPHLMQPLSTFVQKMVSSFLRNHGSASLSVTINKGGYYPGESIAFSVKVENQSTKQVNAIQVSLVQMITYCGQLQALIVHYKKSRHVNNIIQSIQGSGIPAGNTGHWSNGLLPVPTTYPTINGNIITLSYAVDVTANFHNAGNISVQIPVTIGTTPQPGEQTQCASVTACYPPPYAPQYNYTFSPQLTGTSS